MTQFNKGDRVIRTRYGYGGLVQGSTYIVDCQVGNTLYVEGFIAGYTASSFELANVVRPASPWPFRGTHKGTFSGSQINLQNLPKAEGAYNPNVGHTTDGGGLQQHSIGGPFPFVLVGIENPKGLRPGTYWYVQDKTGRRVTAHHRNCNMTGNIAAGLVSLYPDGICPDATPDLSASDGWIDPIIKIELNREAAETLQMMCANTAGPMTYDILAALSEALGYTYDQTQPKYDVSFLTSGDAVHESGWHKGRNQRGALAITPKGTPCAAT